MNQKINKSVQNQSNKPSKPNQTQQSQGHAIPQNDGSLTSNDQPSPPQQQNGQNLNPDQASDISPDNRKERTTQCP